MMINRIHFCCLLLILVPVAPVQIEALSNTSRPAAEASFGAFRIRGSTRGNSRIPHRNASPEFLLSAFGADPNGAVDIHTALINASKAVEIAGGGTIRVAAGRYLLDTATIISFGEDIVFQWDANAVLVLAGNLVMEPSYADDDLVLQSNTSLFARTMTFDDADRLKADDVIWIETRQSCGPAAKMESAVVQSVDHVANVVTFTKPLNHAYSTTDMGLRIMAYGQRRLCWHGGTIRSDDTNQSLQLRGFNGCTMSDIILEDSDPKGTLMVLHACNADLMNITFVGGQYGCEVARANGVYWMDVTGWGQTGCPIAPLPRATDLVMSTSVICLTKAPVLLLTAITHSMSIMTLCMPRANTH